MSTRTRTDLLIVGGGPAGVSAALTAASLGMHTVLVEA
ncbi:FAD-dependent oxidoreductase, partial [Streptomyces sp. NPDC002586]